MIYDVIRKSDKRAMTSYCSSQVVEQINEVAYPVSDYDHIERQEDAVISDTRKFGGRRILTKLEFRSLFPGDAIKAIDRFEAQFEQAAFLTDDQKDSIRTSFNDYHAAADVNLDDPRWLPGLGLYVSLGMMTEAEVSEVLNG